MHRQGVLIQNTVVTVGRSFSLSHSSQTRRGAGQARVASTGPVFPSRLPSVHPHPRSGRRGAEVMFPPDDTLQKLPTSPPIARCPEGGHTAPTQLQLVGNAVFFPRDRFPAKKQALSKGQVLSNKPKSLSRSCKT